MKRKVEKQLKKTISGLLALSLLCSMLAACSGSGETSSASESGAPASTAPVSSETPGDPSSEETSPEDAGAMSGAITVISRESGSGTRGAFIELFGVEVKDDAGNKSDTTTPEAIEVNSTNAVLTGVAADKNAIGYVSLGSLGDTVKALDIDGAKASAENVASGTYKVARPFNIATKGEASGLAKDFIDFILSAEGQAVVEESGYIKVGEPAPFAGSKPEGKLVIAGSSSVTPVMEKLKEAYLAINSAATIEIQQSDSTSGMQAALDGTCDIGMASRELKDTETAELSGIQIALDGIAVVVNTENPLTALSSENVKGIYTGGITDWSDVK
nr:substrate-binding domain-containing protein [Provencibacterium massiliense]